MLHGLFVTGTDTGVGKTVVSAALMLRYSRPGLRYWKPVQTGIEQDDDTAEVAKLADCAGRVFDAGVRLPRPVSPHLAARLAGKPIDMEALLASISREDPAARWIVEGAGGALVPVNDSNLMADLIGLLGLHAVVVTRTTLGTINHTLLTIEALRQRTLQVAGVVMVGEPNPDNRQAIEQYGRVPVIGELPCLRPLTPASLASWAPELDRGGRLLPFLR